MRFFRWMQNKFNGGQSDKCPNAVLATNDTEKLEAPKEELPHGLLAIGTFGNSTDNLKHKQLQINPNLETEYFSEAVKLEKELKKLLTKKQDSKSPIADRFSLEVDCSISNILGTFLDGKDEEEVDRTIRVILGRCKDVCEKKNKEKMTIGKKSLAFLANKIFAWRSGFAPNPSLRDAFQESRMEMLMRTLLTKKIYSQNSYRESLPKKYLEDYNKTAISKTEEEKDEEPKNPEGSKWDKTDSDYIVLDI